MPEGWTPTQVKHLLDEKIGQVMILFNQKIEDRDKAVSAALVAQKEINDERLNATERAIQKAEAASDKRFDGVNEFRRTLSDQAGQFMPRNESYVEFKALKEKLDAIATRLERHEAKGAGISAGWGYLVGLVGFLAAVAGLAARFIGG